MDARQRIVRHYLLPSGKNPFLDWLSGLKNQKAHAIILERIDRLQLGNFGEYKRLSGGLNELKIRYGPGYRIYFGEMDDVIVVLLCGGNKNSQRQDIKRAIQYWNEFLSRQS